jgi:hypothetical protein
MPMHAPSLAETTAFVAVAELKGAWWTRPPQQNIEYQEDRTGDEERALTYCPVCGRKRG